MHGTGVFAATSIAKGTRVWEFTKGLDRFFTDDEFISLSAAAQQWIVEKGYKDKEQQLWFAPFGEAAFINHHREANITPGPDGEYCDYATRHIAAGEEILANYQSYYAPNERQAWLKDLLP